MPARAFQIAVGCTLVAACALGVRSTLRSGDWLNAQVFYERTIAAGGWSPRVAVNLAIIYGHQGRLEPARELLERSLASWPDYPLARNHLGRHPRPARQTRGVKSIFAAAVAAAPTQKTVYPRTWTASILVARRAVAEGRDEDALRILAGARESRAKSLAVRTDAERNPPPHCQGPEAALPIIQQFAEANWWQYPAHLALGKVKSATRRRRRGARSALRHASRLDIRETEALNLMTRISAARGQSQAALRAQRRAVARQPDQPSQHRLVCGGVETAGHDDQAEKAIATAKALEQRVSA